MQVRRLVVMLAALSLPGSVRGQVATLELQPARVSVIAGDTVRLTLTARDRNGAALSTQGAFFGSGPFEIASVDQRGVVYTSRRGSARVIARLGGKVATADIEIRPKPPVRLELSTAGATLVPQATTVVQGMAYDRDKEPITDAKIEYRSLDEHIVKAGPGGVVEALRVGTARIEASVGGVRQAMELRVVANPVARIAVTGPRTARTGDVVRFGATATNSAGRPVGDITPHWSVSGAGATVYPDGGFVAANAGTFVVTASVGSRAASTAVYVTPRVHDRKVEQVHSTVFSELQAAEGWAIGDVWYVSTVADRVYAFDIRDPANPRLVDSVMVDARIVNDISTTADGKIGLMTREGASSRKNGIVFLDLTDPLHPKVLSEFTETVTSGVHSAFIDGHYAYITDDGRRALRIIDFADPRKPKEVASWSTSNSVVVGDRPTSTPSGFEGTVSGRYLHDVQVLDGLAYLAYFKDGLIILDVGNGIKGGSPTNPQFVSQFTYNTTDFYPPDMLAGTHTVFRFRNYLIAGDEVFPQFFDSSSRDHIKTLGRLHILDVTDITKPKLVAFYEVPGQGSHNVWVENDVLYIGNFEAGLRVVDVSGELRGDLKAQGREIGSVWTASAKGFRPNAPMAWGAQPHKGHIYVTDMNSGAWVAKLTPRVVP